MGGEPAEQRFYGGMRDMSVFSELLKGYVDRCGVTVVSLAKQCGADRTTLHKIISGERKPPGEDFVIKLSRLLMLSSAERDAFLEQYEISLVGDELYRRRRNVNAMIRKLSEVGEETLSEAESFYRSEPKTDETSSYYYGKQAVLQAVFSEVTADLMKGAPICIITQPSERFLRFMKYALMFYKGSEIRHIFCLDNSAGDGGANDYNLDLFPKVCELAVVFGNYRPMYYYDRVASHINAASLLPIMVVGESFMFRAPFDIESAAIVRDRRAVDFSRKEFGRIAAMCYPFLERANGISGMLGKGASYHDYSLTIDFQPTFVFSAYEEVIRKSFHFTEEQLGRFMERIDYLKKRYLGREYMDVFTAEGLRSFLRNGIIKELPENICEPLPPGLRISMIEEIIGFCERGDYDFRVVENQYAPLPRMRINMDADGTVHFVIRTKAGYVFLTVGEQSMGIAMRDYIDSLIETGKIYGRERSIETMKDILASAKMSLAEVPDEDINKV